VQCGWSVICCSCISENRETICDVIDIWLRNLNCSRWCLNIPRQHFSLWNSMTSHWCLHHCRVYVHHKILSTVFCVVLFATTVKCRSCLVDLCCLCLAVLMLLFLYTFMVNKLKKMKWNIFFFLQLKKCVRTLIVAMCHIKKCIFAIDDTSIRFVVLTLQPQKSEVSCFVWR